MADQTLDMADTLDFGKHRGQTVEHVCRSNPAYIHWMHGAGFRMTDRVLRLASSVRTQNSEDAARRFGSAGDWGFAEY